MNKKKITLLIALSIMIFLLLTFWYPPVASGISPKESAQKKHIEESQPNNKIIAQQEEAPIIQEPTLEVPNVRDFKSYTNYRMLNRQAPQWTNVQAIAHSDAQGFRRVEDYYCVAMGSYYTTTLGDLFKITTETGNVFEVIITDFKSDLHTDNKHQYTAHNSCIVEFYVDMNYLDSYVAYTGNISTINDFNGRIITIQKLGNYFTK